MQTKGKKGILKSILSVLTALIFFTGINPLYFVKRNETAAAEDYHTWRQMDPRWGNVSMNGTTVAKSGCLITSLSIMARASDSLDSTALKNLGISRVDDFNPGILANAYTNRGGFSYGGAIASWGTIGQIIPQITFVRDSYLNSYTKEGIAAEIKAMMDQGLHVIVNVNWHWVYIEGVVGSDIYMIDPASDTVLLYDEYQLSGGNEYWALTCKNPPAPFNPSESETTTTTTEETTTTTTTDTTTTTEATTTTKTTTATTTNKNTTTTTKKTTTTTTNKTTTTTTKRTTTTTSSKTTTVPTTTTTTTSVSKPITVVTTTAMQTGEYFNPGTSEIGIYNSSDCTGEPTAFVRPGEVVNALECMGTIGHIAGTKDFAGWVDLSGMTIVTDKAPREKGDINGDGKIDMYDLGLLGDYLKSLADMPDGVSILTSCEAEAADINGDGKVSSGDVLVCLMLVCD